MSHNVEKLLNLFVAAKARREMWRSLFQEAHDYALPQKETFNFHSPGGLEPMQPACNQRIHHLGSNGSILLLAQTLRRVIETR